MLAITLCCGTADLPDCASFVFTFLGHSEDLLPPDWEETAVPASSSDCPVPLHKVGRWGPISSLLCQQCPHQLYGSGRVVLERKRAPSPQFPAKRMKQPLCGNPSLSRAHPPGSLGSSNSSVVFYHSTAIRKERPIAALPILIYNCSLALSGLLRRVSQ